MDAKEEVRSRLAIEDVIGEYVPLKRAGRSWKGLSPFSQERTPSFFVSPDKQIWHDFSSNKGGDVFSFVMEVEGIDFRAALELLARKAGVDMSLYDKGFDKGLADKKRRLYSALDLAATYYQRCLFADKTAIDYVAHRRKVDKQTVLDFKIGYAPASGNALMTALRAKGYTEDELYDAGLVSQRRGGLGDMFRDRMMVVLADGQGQVIGFTARIIADVEGAPKYINTPQTLLYDKSRHVFGLHLAKDAIRRADYAVVVEGQLDVVSSHQAGVRNVVATAGTALTEYHLKALARLSCNVRLSFDGDKAGTAATERAIPIAQKVGVDLSIITLPGGQDPDDLIKHDPAAWQAAIESPRPAVEWLIDRYLTLHDVATASGKRRITTAGIAVIKEITDAVEREHYVSYLADKVGSTRETIALKMAGEAVQPKTYKPIAPATGSTMDAEAPHHDEEDIVLGLALLDARVRPLLATLSAEVFSQGNRRAVYAALTTATSADELAEGLRKVQDCVKMALFKAETMYGTIDDVARYQGAQEKIKKLQHTWNTTRGRNLSQLLDQAIASGDTERAKELGAELAILLKEKKRAQR